MIELGVADLRFTWSEVTTFLNEVMGLPLTAQDIATLEERTEGWIAGLQLAALAMRDQSNLSGFVSAFTGSNRFVVDYLVSEVLARQPAHVQTFLLQTAILERLCGSLCDVVMGIAEVAQPPSRPISPAASEPALAAHSYSQNLLEALERANLFLLPLDNDRRWYRYHHLFAEVLRGRLVSGATAEMVLSDFIVSRFGARRAPKRETGYPLGERIKYRSAEGKNKVLARDRVGPVSKCSITAGMSTAVPKPVFNIRHTFD